MTAHEEAGPPPACPEADVLVDLQALLGPEPGAALDHLRSCRRCRETLEVLALVHRAHVPEEELGRVDEGELAEGVLRALEGRPDGFPGRGAPAPGRRRPGTGVRAHPGAGLGLAASVAAAGLAGFFGALLVGSGAPGEVGPGAALLAAAVTAALPLVGGLRRRGTAADRA